MPARTAVHPWVLDLPEMVLDRILLNLHALSLAGALTATCQSFALACGRDELCQEAYTRDLAPEIVDEKAALPSQPSNENIQLIDSPEVALPSRIDRSPMRTVRSHSMFEDLRVDAPGHLPTLSECEPLADWASQELRSLAVELHGRNPARIAAAAATEGRPGLLAWAAERAAVTATSTGANQSGRSTLMLAAMNNFPKTSVVAIATGCAVDQEYGSFGTALHMAAYAGAAEAASVLCKHGANLETRNATYRQTPLHVALSRNQVGVVHILLGAKADAAARDKDGMSCLTLARDRCPVAAELLSAALEQVQAEDDEG